MTHEEYARLPICQSCGMPMQADAQRGKNADGSMNPEYCIYCCPQGEEKMQGTLEEMITLCARIETQMGLHPSEEAAKAKLGAYLPTLKRWKNRSK